MDQPIPFEANTSLSIDIANRLFTLKSHPGFHDLVRISQETVKVAEDAFVEFEGWDKDELAARSIAFRAAKRFHEMLFQKIEAAIQNGIEELRQSKAAQQQQPVGEFSKEAADMADSLRVAALQYRHDGDETRIPGSY